MNMGMVEDCVREIGNNGGWYSLMKMMKANGGALPKVSMCIGARRTGKTVYLTRLAILLWQRFGRTTLWLRNMKVEYENPGFFGRFLNAAKEFGYCSEDWKCDKEGVKDPDGNLVITFGSLSTFSNLRGNADFTTDLIVMDEFMPESGRYPKHCATGLLSISRTIFSGREDARIVMAANDIQLGNPYFCKWRVYPDQDKDVTVFPSGFGIEKLYGYRRAKPEGQWADLYKSAGYTDYMDSVDEDVQVRLIEPLPKTAQPEPFCIMPESGQVYRGWRHKGYLWYAPYNGSRKGLVCYTNEPRFITNDCYLMEHFTIRRYEDALKAGRLRFTDAVTLYDIMSMCFQSY